MEKPVDQQDNLRMLADLNGNKVCPHFYPRVLPMTEIVTKADTVLVLYDFLRTVRGRHRSNRDLARNRGTRLPDEVRSLQRLLTFDQQ